MGRYSMYTQINDNKLPDYHSYYYCLKEILLLIIMEDEVHVIFDCPDCSTYRLP